MAIAVHFNPILDISCDKNVLIQITNNGSITCIFLAPRSLTLQWVIRLFISNVETLRAKSRTRTADKAKRMVDICNSLRVGVATIDST